MWRLVLERGLVTDDVPDSAQHDLRLRRRGDRQLRAVPPPAPGPALAAVCRARDQDRPGADRPLPAHRPVRQHQVLLPRRAAAHPAGGDRDQRGRARATGATTRRRWRRPWETARPLERLDVGRRPGRRPTTCSPRRWSTSRRACASTPSTSFPAGPAGRGGRHRAHAPDPRRLHVQVRGRPRCPPGSPSCWNAVPGVCQDYTHFMVSGLRSLGLAGRYVSGYLATRPPPGKERLVGRRRQPRLGRLLGARRRLAVPGSHQQPPHRRAPTPPWPGGATTPTSPRSRA